MEAINLAIAKMSREDTEGGFSAIRKEMFADMDSRIGYRPSTWLLTAMWHDILGQQYAHLRLAQEHFSLNREYVERYMRQNLNR